jgi:hypothetical protein
MNAPFDPSLLLAEKFAVGQPVSRVTVSLPVGWLNAMLNALPQTRGPDTVHPPDSWSMDRLTHF